MTNSQTTLTVSSAAGYPTVPNFRILADSEIMLVTALAGVVFTVTRGYEGTTAVAHAAGVIVKHSLTAGSLSQILSETTREMTLTAFQALSATDYRTGQQVVLTDHQLSAKRGVSSWAYYLKNVGVTPPTTGWSFGFQGSATLTSTLGHLVDFSTTSSYFTRVKSSPSTPYNIEFGFNGSALVGDNVTLFVGYRNSGSDTMYAVELFGGGGAQTRVARYAAGATFSSADYTSSNGFVARGAPFFIKLTNDGTNKTFQVSSDKIFWTTLYSVGSSVYLTPDQVVWGMVSSGGIVAQKPLLCHYSE